MIEGRELASTWKCPFIECSAKTNEHIGIISFLFKISAILILHAVLVDVFTTLIKEIEKDSGLLDQDIKSSCIII